MKKLLIVFIALLFAVSAFAQSGSYNLSKRELGTLRKIKFYKIVAAEEQKILSVYINCLNKVNTENGLMACNNQKKQLAMRLRSVLSPNRATRGRQLPSGIHNRRPFSRR